MEPEPNQPDQPARPALGKARAIIDGLGGAQNILEIEPCITRLRTEVRDGTLVSESALKSAGVHGVSRRGTIVQVIVGPEADVLAQDIEDQLAAEEDQF
ncbi:MAG TPA: PTS glucose/sucrose transporter subunit IIB [Acidothermaceae bacterium]|jgi:PTS system N-acetylglucosamine-specific IIB component|nr:PTS glucose/sucrose transporter subunit IIB [Acidothermaceae bacterium]